MFNEFLKIWKAQLKPMNFPVKGVSDRKGVMLINKATFFFKIYKLVYEKVKSRIIT